MKAAKLMPRTDDRPCTPEGIYGWGYRHPASISSIRILFLASIVLCLLTRSAVSVIIAINRRPVSAAMVVCVRVLFLLRVSSPKIHMIISSGVAYVLNSLSIASVTHLTLYLTRRDDKLDKL